jgi:3-hydroxybutyryl-CoA dehydratase
MSLPVSDFSSISQLGCGAYWQELAVGTKVKTRRRTITEADLVNFVSVTGMLEPIFIDVTHEGAMAGRPVPAALTYGIIEGFILQHQIQGVALALLSASMEAKAPVRVGDTIWATIETTKIKPTSKGNRAVIESSVTIFNQLNEVVLVYTVTRLLAGKPD